MQTKHERGELLDSGLIFYLTYEVDLLLSRPRRSNIWGGMAGGFQEQPDLDSDKKTVIPIFFYVIVFVSTFILLSLYCMS